MDVYHVTHEDNVESIRDSGLEGSASINHDYAEYVFVVPTLEDADDVIDVYFSGPEAVVIKAQVAEYKLIEDPDPHGELNSFAHNGSIDPSSIEVLEAGEQ
jgi:hypothetical protein